MRRLRARLPTVATKEVEAVFVALRGIASLRSELDEAEYRLVAGARALGATWDDVGEEMGGISRQAARSRYGKRQARYRG